MPTETKELLSELITRLPELEWKISGLGSSFSIRSLPKGLFRTNIGENAAACIAEIKQDIQTLSQQKPGRSALYLAERITRKVNVLVAVCHVYGRKNKAEEKTSFGVTMLSTRQQWIQELEKDIHTLEQQQQAMLKTLEQMQRNHHDATAILHLKAELGKIERHLTLAAETLNRAVT